MVPAETFNYIFGFCIGVVAGIVYVHAVAYLRERNERRKQFENLMSHVTKENKDGNRNIC